MKTKDYHDNFGVRYREIISRNYSRLRQLEEEYKKIGKRTWVGLFDGCEGSWFLTVEGV